MKDTIVVTHPGAAHRDEFLASCLLIAANKAARIERRDCTAVDLENPEVFVLDQGGRHEPDKLNFDHHQLERDAAPTCSITFILPYLGIDVEEARQIWPWLEFSELLDSKGPKATAVALGSNPDTFMSGISPIEESILRWFAEEEVILPSSRVWAIMKRIGVELLDYLDKVVKRVERLYQESTDVYVGDLLFVDAACIDRDDNPTLGLEIFCQQMPRPVAGTITQDDRGQGLSLFRRKDHPRVDFSRIASEEGVLFAHNGGFVAKLEAGVDPLPLLAKACAGAA